MPVETVDRLEEVVAAILALSKKRILVGIPEETTDQHGSRHGAISNSALGYIMEHGEPAVGIPARRWLEPGVEEALPEIEPYLESAARAAMAGDMSGADQQLASAGILAASAVRNYVQAGIAPPLKPATVRARRRRMQGSSYRRQAATAANTIPLIDTADMIKSVTYVIRNTRG
jgi:hypothetical protein